ncbi:MAG: BatD family protein, partial [Verrucomicrobiota bacterium]
MERLSWKKQLERRGGALLARGAVLLLGALMLGRSFAATFTTSLDRDTVILGENVTLTFKFEGVQPGGLPQLPAIPGLQPTGGTSSGFNSSSGPDGKMQVVQTFAVPFVTQRTGDIVIPGFNVEV